MLEHLPPRVPGVDSSKEDHSASAEVKTLRHYEGCGLGERGERRRKGKAGERVP